MYVVIIGHGTTKLDVITMSNSFVVPLKKWGNSYILKVPPAIAKLYELGTEVQVTIEGLKKQ